MTKSVRSLLVLAAAVTLAGTLAFADSGEATYKAKCATCHGPAGTPSAGMAKMMGIKAVSDPSMKALCEEWQGQDEAGCRAHRCADQGRGHLLPLAQVGDRIKNGMYNKARRSRRAIRLQTGISDAFVPKIP